MNCYGEAVTNRLEHSVRRRVQIPASSTGETPFAAELAAAAAEDAEDPVVANPLHSLVIYLSGFSLKQLLDDFTYMPKTTFVSP